MNAKQKNRKMITAGQRMLIGMVVGLAATLCALEYGRPILEQEQLGEPIAKEIIEITIPVTRREKPKPPEKIEVEHKIQKEVWDKFKTVIDKEEMPQADAVSLDEPQDLNLLAMYIEPEHNVQGAFLSVEIMPEFSGGEEGLFEFLGDNIEYPARAKEDGIQGTVFLRFVIGKDGKVDKNKIEVLKSSHPLLTQEAVRAIKSMPKWRPGLQQGHPVPVYITLPIRFRLSP